VKKKLAGLRAKRNGQRSEHVLETTASALSLMIYKRYEPYKRISRSGTKSFRAVYLGKSGCDYSVFLSDGRAGMIEVKSRQSRINKSALDEVQHSQLDNLKKMGHLAYVLIYISECWILVDYSAFMQPDRKSHTLPQLLEIGVQLTCRNNVLVDLEEHL